MNRVTFDFAGTAVLVTGGTSGIGHATARAFSDAGAEVTVTGTAADPARYATDLDGFTYRHLDLTDPASVDDLVAATGRLDVLVNNAGANFPGGRDEWDPDGFASALQVNLAGPMRLTVGVHGALAASRIEGGASVVNIASMASFRPVPLVPGYGSAKSGLVALTRNLARRWVGDGIRVNAVAPGVIDTPMTAPLGSLPEMRDAELAHIPMGVMGSPGDVTGAVLFLSSSAAAYVTGHTLAVDGGYLLI